MPSRSERTVSATDSPRAESEACDVQPAATERASRQCHDDDLPSFRNVRGRAAGDSAFERARFSACARATPSGALSRASRNAVSRRLAAGGQGGPVGPLQSAVAQPRTHVCSRAQHNSPRWRRGGRLAGPDVDGVLVSWSPSHLAGSCPAFPQRVPAGVSGWTRVLVAMPSRGQMRCHTRETNAIARRFCQAEMARLLPHTDQKSIRPE
jgi:hypothetical protein